MMGGLWCVLRMFVGRGGNLTSLIWTAEVSEVGQKNRIGLKAVPSESSMDLHVPPVFIQDLE